MRVIERDARSLDYSSYEESPPPSNSDYKGWRQLYSGPLIFLVYHYYRIRVHLRQKTNRRMKTVARRGNLVFFSAAMRAQIPTPHVYPKAHTVDIQVGYSVLVC